MKIETLHHINPYADKRPDGVLIDTIVIHSMFAEGTPHPMDVFSCHQTLINHHVSAHYYIDQKGGIFSSIPVILRAWHAGNSTMPLPNDTRQAVNDFSVGIELISDLDLSFSKEQYESVIFLIQNISSKHPISAIVGHDQIAPGRKTDPGLKFDWKILRKEFKNYSFDPNC